MSPVPFEHPVRYTSLALVGAHLTSIVYLTYAIAAGLYTSYKSLGPAQSTRSRHAQRSRLIPVFFGLALFALSAATYNSVNSSILSYRTWAHEHGVNQPERLIPREELTLKPNTSSTPAFLHVAQWLSDTPIYYDALEIVAEKARRFWWGQQVHLATVAFSMLLSVEGRRRNIPLTPAFLVLAHLVNLSFAQNLFYLALLLTPSPLPSEREGLELPVVPLRPSRLIRIRDKFIIPKPRNWHLRTSIHISALSLNYIFIFLLPYAADTPSFVKVALLTQASTFLPLILPEVAPVGWGSVYSHPHEAYGSFTTIFRTISVASFVLHIKSSISGLVHSVPNSYHHRHSLFIPWDVEERTNWERSTTALGKVLGSLYDHPTVNAVGCDVLVCAISLGLWAAVRATDVQDIIALTIPAYNLRGNTKPIAEDTRPHTPIKADSEPPEDRVSEHSMTLRRRGRSAKSRLGSVASSSGLSEDGNATPGRKRGRPKKTKQQEEEKAYEPPPSKARELVEGDVLPVNELDWESAALAWGIVAFAGLGSATAGVFGGECITR